MKYFILIFFTNISLVLNVFSQYNFEWVKNYGTGSEIVTQIDLDDLKNIYAAGILSTPGIIGNDTLVNQDASNSIFVSKFDNLGNSLWTKQIIQNAGVAAHESCEGMAVGIDGSVVVTGIIEDSVYFGKDTVISAYGGWNKDIYLAKYNTNGGLEWVKSFHTDVVATERAYDVVIDATNNIYICGQYYDSITIGTTTLKSDSGDFSLTNMFIAKFNALGQTQWARKATYSNNTDKATALALTPQGSLVVMGEFKDSLVFDDIELVHTENVQNSNHLSFFIAQLNSLNGYTESAKAFDLLNDSETEINSMVCDKNGNIYFTGDLGSSFNNTAYFDTYTVQANGGIDAFVVKTDALFNVQWAKNFGTESHFWGDYGRDITLTDNHVFVTGAMYSSSGMPAIFDSIQLNTQGYRDVFIAQITKNGVVEHVFQGKGAEHDFGNGICADANNNVYFAADLGYNFSGYDFDTIHINNINNNDFAIGKFKINYVIDSIVFTNNSCYQSNDGSIEIFVNYGHDSIKYSIDNCNTLKTNGLFDSLLIGDYYPAIITPDNDTIWGDTITILQPDSINLYLGVDTTLFLGDSLVLYGGNNAYNYMWQDSTSYTDSVFVFYADSMGIFEIFVTKTDTITLCNKSDTIVITVDNDTKIKEENNYTFSIYPNPVSESFVHIHGIDFSNDIVEIYDVLGKKVASQIVINNTINVETLKNGMYIIKIPAKQITKQIIKK